MPESLEVIQERVCSVCVAAHGKMDETCQLSFRTGSLACETQTSRIRTGREEGGEKEDGKWLLASLTSVAHSGIVEKLVLSRKNLIWSQGGPPSLHEASPETCSVHVQQFLPDRLPHTQQVFSCLRFTSPSSTPALCCLPSPSLPCPYPWEPPSSERGLSHHLLWEALPYNWVRLGWSREVKSSPGHEGTFTPDSGRTKQNPPGVAVKGHTANSGRQTRKGAQQVQWGSERTGSR